MRLSTGFVRVFLPAVLLVGFLAGPVLAANIRWRNAAGGDWAEASNWETGQVPGPLDRAFIELPEDFTVTITTDVTIRSLTLEGEFGVRVLQVNGVALSTSLGITVGVNDVLQLDSGTLSGAGVLNLSGQLLSDGTSSITCPLETTNASTITLKRALSVANGFTNHGLLEYVDGTFHGELTVVNGVLTNSPTGTISSAVVSGWNSYLYSALDNQGTMNVRFLHIEKSGAAHVNSGNIVISTGGFYPGLYVSQFNLNSTFTTSGSITVAASSEFRVIGGELNQTAGSISGPGKIRLEAAATGTFASNPSTGDIELDGALAYFPSPLVHGAQVLTFRNTGIVAPSLTIEAGRVLSLPGSHNWEIPNVRNFGTLEIRNSTRMIGGTCS